MASRSVQPYSTQSLVWCICINSRPIAKGGGGGVPPAKPECLPLCSIDWVVFYEKLSFISAVLWASNMPKMHWRPDPTGRAHNAPPDLLVSWEGGHQSQCPTLLGASILAPSVLRSSCPPLKPGAPRSFRAGYGPDHLCTACKQHSLIIIFKCSLHKSELNARPVP